MIKINHNTNFIMNYIFKNKNEIFFSLVKIFNKINFFLLNFKKENFMIVKKKFISFCELENKFIIENKFIMLIEYKKKLF
tara:strand:- start:108 stop:347 length:240 start_codon:yes stop_codon:yes gene_type:complete